MTYVYVITPILLERPVKIGIADDPEKRMTELQTGNPHKLCVWASVALSASGAPARTVAYRLERDVHRHLAGHAMNGEWFDITAKEGLAAIRAVRMATSDVGWGRLCERQQRAKLEAVTDWTEQISKINSALYRHTGRTCAPNILASLLNRHGYANLCAGFRRALTQIPLIKQNGKTHKPAVRFLVAQAGSLARLSTSGP